MQASQTLIFTIAPGLQVWYPFKSSDY